MIVLTVIKESLSNSLKVRTRHLMLLMMMIMFVSSALCEEVSINFCHIYDFFISLFMFIMNFSILLCGIRIVNVDTF